MRIKNEAPCPAVAMLRPRSGLAQWMVREEYMLDPWVPTVEYTDVYGNLCQRLTVPAGGMRIDVEVVMDTEDALAVDPDARATPVEELPDAALVYLLPSRYCPSDRMEEKAKAIAHMHAPGYAQVEAIRRWIHEQLRYEYGVSDSATDAMQTLEAGAGVCRDFAHVGIALTRALRIPARMVAGYLHGLEPMDMHAWFEAFVGGRWYTFDATQASPRGGRIVVGYGRDAADVAFMSNYGPMDIEDMTVSVEKLPATGRGPSSKAKTARE
ncbi:transglutaminase family protein [Variovorax sp. OV329]|uniref:transglutaminase domain-containing protein n=1 Tax=Variovorax sp. OV329 TaxID=1882825 RepID=UPI000B87C55A|nr:transglutaminase family protein [Variovorax sp. OV329]